mgnify:CR=1 FL=1|tara:strand:- start:587 stop:799 length:213 start_codon:yes stop_codon:yes gene_type:complete
MEASIKKRRRSSKVSYQEGFSVAGAALLARPWIRQEPEPNFEDFTLAAFIEGPAGYYWNDEANQLRERAK